MSEKISYVIPDGFYRDVRLAVEEGCFKVETPGVILTQDDLHSLHIGMVDMMRPFNLEFEFYPDDVFEMEIVEEITSETVTIHGKEELWYLGRQHAGESTISVAPEEATYVHVQQKFWEVEKVD